MIVSLKELINTITIYSGMMQLFTIMRRSHRENNVTRIVPKLLPFNYPLLIHGYTYCAHKDGMALSDYARHLISNLNNRAFATTLGRYKSELDIQKDVDDQTLRNMTDVPCDRVLT